MSVLVLWEFRLLVARVGATVKALAISATPNGVGNPRSWQWHLIVEFGPAYPQDVGVGMLTVPLAGATVVLSVRHVLFFLWFRSEINPHAEAEKDSDPGLQVLF